MNPHQIKELEKPWLKLNKLLNKLKIIAKQFNQKEKLAKTSLEDRKIQNKTLYHNQKA